MPGAEGGLGVPVCFVNLLLAATGVDVRGEYVWAEGAAPAGPPEGVMAALALFCLVGLALVLLLAATEGRDG